MSEKVTRADITLTADGGSRGNPGLASYGTQLRDTVSGEVLAERKLAIARATNNVAEYCGLLAGLLAAAELGARRVSVRMDSKLVVEQMAGRWKVKHPDMIPLHRRAREIAAGFEHVSYRWIPRAENSEADRLANEAMDAVASGALAASTSELMASLGVGTGAVAATVAPVASTAEMEVEAEEDGLFGRDGAVPAPAAAAPADPSRARPPWQVTGGAPLRLLLLRHGQTELSVRRAYSGHGDPALTELGHRQAAGAAKHVSAMGEDIAAIVTSPLTRARQTALAAGDALGLTPILHPGLIETNFGQWEGLTFAEAAARDPQLHAAWLGDTSVPPPGGESFDAVAARIAAVRAELAEQYGGRTVLLVSHVTPIKSFLREALDAGPSILYRLHLDLASLSIAEFYPDGPSTVRLANETTYLR